MRYEVQTRWRLRSVALAVDAVGEAGLSRRDGGRCEEQEDPSHSQDLRRRQC
jgi:hypothetical protein